MKTYKDFDEMIVTQKIELQWLYSIDLTFKSNEYVTRFHNILVSDPELKKYYLGRLENGKEFWFQLPSKEFRETFSNQLYRMLKVKGSNFDKDYAKLKLL